MTQEEKVRYMRIAAAMSGFVLTLEQTYLLISLYEGVLEKGGQFSVEDAAKIEAEVKAFPLP